MSIIINVWAGKNRRSMVAIAAVGLAVVFLAQGCQKFSKKKKDAAASEAAHDNQGTKEVGEPLPMSPGSEKSPSGSDNSQQVVVENLDGIGSHSLDNLIWKRHASLESDLARGLEIKPSELCLELGQRSCVRDVYLFTLGGNDPIDRAQYQRAAGPVSTTAVALERVALSACGKRVNEDQMSGQAAAKVFRFFPLGSGAYNEGPEALDQLSTELYRRLLQRNPEQAERDEIRQILNISGISRSDVAKLTCYVVATSIEFLFF